MRLQTPDILRRATLSGACWLGLTALLPAAEGLDRPEVRVDGLRLTPMGNLGGVGERHALHPKGLLGLGYDSNVYATENNRTGDLWWRVVAGVEGRYSPSFIDLLVYDATINLRSWARTRDRDLIGGSLDFEWAREGITLQSSTTLRWARLRDPLIQNGLQIERSEWAASYKISAEGATTIRELSLGLKADDYHDATDSFSRDSRDNLRIRLAGDLHLLRSETSRLSLGAALGLRRYRNDDDFNDSTWLQTTLGWRGRLGLRSLLALSGGLQYRRYRDDFRGDQAYGDRDVLLPLVTLLLRWDAAEESELDLMAYSQGSDSLSANTAWITGLRLDGRMPLTRRLAGNLGLNAYQVRDSGSAAAMRTELRRTLAAHTTLTYALREGLSSRLHLAYADSKARVGQNFQRADIRLEFAAAF